MPYAPTRNISKLRREKRRNRASDDMVDCQSLADIEFCVDPRIPRRKVNPYDSATDSLLVKQSKRKKRKFKNCPVVRKWSKYSERMYIERSNSEAKDGEQYHIRLGCRSSLCMLSEHSTNTDFDQSILALRDRDQHYNHLERHCSIGPSPLAQNVGSLMQNVGFVSVDFFIHLCRLISYAGSYQGPIGALLIIACIYYSLVYVEISVVSAIEIGLEWAWPVLHIWLRSLESVLKTAVAAVQGVDNLGESLMCDLASHWCSQFNLMCQHRCSFTTKTLDNFRYR